jgi:single-stranded DNA-binding protein
MMGNFFGAWGKIDGLTHRTTQGGKSWATMTVIDESEFVKQDGTKGTHTTYHSCTAWGAAAELLKEFGDGDVVFVKGTREDRHREDITEKKVYVNSIKLQSVERLTGGASRAQARPDGAHAQLGDDLPF